MISCTGGSGGWIQLPAGGRSISSAPWRLKNGPFISSIPPMVLASSLILCRGIISFLHLGFQWPSDTLNPTQCWLHACFVAMVGIYCVTWSLQHTFILDQYSMGASLGAYGLCSCICEVLKLQQWLCLVMHCVKKLAPNAKPSQCNQPGSIS